MNITDGSELRYIQGLLCLATTTINTAREGFEASNIFETLLLILQSQ